ncbi:YaeQ family protein [Polyangium sorediatum]|uniref:YaeQ family protein n=1 Tax=Polyangium sorediatum TaxID=889274 RepID=A0ABT6NJK4_9BACT|nr:YaeQ family protein [Polyangium sorediatum]MDI1428490.1 YaeQ family protein [Polyangium sorediatum]
MALTATIYHLQVNLSDVDRGVYETFDLRLARHPSESMRYLLTRTIAYCLSYEEGITFSKEGLCSTEEPPVVIRDPTGLLVAWIDIGSPSAERLHKAAKAARRVALFTHAPLALLQREASSRVIHKVEAIEVWRIEPTFLDAVEAKVDRNTKLDLLRDDEQLYITVGDNVVTGTITRCSLVEK